MTRVRVGLRPARRPEDLLLPFLCGMAQRMMQLPPRSRPNGSTVCHRVAFIGTASYLVGVSAGVSGPAASGLFIGFSGCGAAFFSTDGSTGCSGPATSGWATFFYVSLSADIRDPEVSVPTSVPAIIYVTQLRNCKLSGKVSACAGERAPALRQPGVIRLEYGLLKRVGELSVKFEKDRRGVIAIAERCAAASDGMCQP